MKLQELRACLTSWISRFGHTGVAKGQFLASMSHEIRTPMNAVLGLAQLLNAEPLTEDQLQMVQRINSAGHSLMGILNDILDFSKIEAGQLSVEPCPFKLTELLGNIDNLLGPVAQGKGLTLRLKENAPVAGLPGTGFGPWRTRIRGYSTVALAAPNSLTDHSFPVSIDRGRRLVRRMVRRNRR